MGCSAADKALVMSIRVRHELMASLLARKAPQLPVQMGPNVIQVLPTAKSFRGLCILVRFVATGRERGGSGEGGEREGFVHACVRAYMHSWVCDHASALLFACACILSCARRSGYLESQVAFLNSMSTCEPHALLSYFSVIVTAPFNARLTPLMGGQSVLWVSSHPIIV